jgi:hypothetical protein
VRNGDNCENCDCNCKHYTWVGGLFHCGNLNNVCFSLENFVTMPDHSLKEMRNLQIGDIVLSIDESGKEFETRVIDIFKYDLNSLSKILINILEKVCNLYLFLIFKVGF